MLLIMRLIIVTLSVSAQISFTFTQDKINRTQRIGGLIVCVCVCVRAFDNVTQKFVDMWWQ